MERGDVGEKFKKVEDREDGTGLTRVVKKMLRGEQRDDGVLNSLGVREQKRKGQ